MNVIIPGVQLEATGRADEIAVCWVAKAGMVLVERSPGAEIVPAEVRRQTEDARLPVALRGARLQHGIVDADVVALWVEAAKGFGKFARPVSGCDLFEDWRGIWQMFAQGIRQCVGAPEKHSTVPEIVASFQELLGRRKIGLLREAANLQRMVSVRCADFDVSVAGLRTCRPDAEDDNIFSGSGDLDALLESFAVPLRLSNDVVRRKEAKHSIWIVSQQEKRREANGRRCVTTNRLCEDLFRNQLWQLPQNGRAEVVVGNDPLAFGRGHRQQAGDGLLEHRLFAIEREQLFGSSLAAQRPEACAASPSQDDRIEVRIRLHGTRKPNTCDGR